MNPESSERNPSPEELRSNLNKLAPFVDKSVDELKKEGWEEFYDYREIENSGAINAEHVVLALEKIDKLMPPVTRETDWQIVRAKDTRYKDYPMEYDRIRVLLRKKTPERIDWDANH